MNSAFLTAEWRKLTIANYSLDPLLIKRYIPFGTELDLWKGKCYVSLVGFRFLNTRLKGLPIPFHINFEEINLRFYVKYKENGIWKRGVSFLKEIVPKRALTFIANTVYKERYITYPTKFSWFENSEYLQVKYAWKHNHDWDSIEVIAKAGPKDLAVGSEEEFITEHFWGYTQLRRDRTSQYQVEHPRWQTYDATKYEIKVRFGLLYGQEFSILDTAIPDSIMLAEGSKVIVRKFEIIK